MCMCVCVTIILALSPCISSSAFQISKIVAENKKHDFHERNKREGECEGDRERGREKEKEGI